MNVQDEIKVLKQRIVELEEQAKKEQEFPQLGDKYWYSDGFGTVLSYEVDYFFTERIIKEMKDIGNIFRTKEQAQFAVEKLKVEAELRKFSRPFMWGTENTAMLFDGDNIKFDTRLSYVFQGAIYFDSENKAKEAIEAVGEDSIKKYIFGVED